MHNPYAAPTAAQSASIPAADTYEPSMFALRGRIGRLRYMSYTFCPAIGATVLIYGYAAIVFWTTGKFPDPGVAGNVVLGAYLPVLGTCLIMARRRLNDLDRTGWHAMWLFVPIINFVLWVYLMCAAGMEWRNEFGPAPAKNTLAAKLGALTLPVIVAIGFLTFKQFDNTGATRREHKRTDQGRPDQAIRDQSGQ